MLERKEHSKEWLLGFFLEGLVSGDARGFSLQKGREGRGGAGVAAKEVG